MKLCHPLDQRFDRIGSGLILQATCCAPKCGRMYARFVPLNQKVYTDSHGRKSTFFRPKTDSVRIRYVKSDDWASLLSMRRLFDEMRCQSDHFCASCEAGHLLTDCQGGVKANG